MKTKPKTTAECEQLMNLVIEGLEANIFDSPKREAARVALKKLCKEKCSKAVEYVIERSNEMPVMDPFAQEISKEATKCLDKLSQ